MIGFNRLTVGQTIACLLALTLLQPSAADARSRKGDKFYAAAKKAEYSGDWEKAFEEYENAIREDPTDTTYQIGQRRMRFEAGARRIDRAQKLRQEGKLEEALTEFERAFMTDPSSALAIQEIKRTKALLDAERRKGVKLGPEERGLTPVQAARRESEQKIGQIQGAPELKPLSRQVTSLKMNNQNVKVLYETLGKLTGVNVVFDPEMQMPSKNFTVDLTNTTLDDSLEYLSTLTKMFWKPLSANTIFITNDNVTKRRDYEENVVKVFYLQNITSVQELNEISVAIRSVTEIRRLFTYNGQNAILARGTVDQVALVEKLLQDLDKPKAEVLVDVIVIETSRGRTRDLASALSTQGISTTVSPALGTDGKGNSLRLPDLRGLVAGDFAVNLPSAILRAVMSDSNSKVRQTPQVRAADGMKASLKIGEKVPTASGSFQPGIGLGGGGVSPLVNTQFQYLDVGVNVDILPKIHGDDEVSLHVEIDISTVKERIDIGGIQQPVIGQRKVIHDLRLREGEMNLIGGLVQQTETRTYSGIPLLMQIPYLGRLFSNESITRNESELMIALVPHIIRSQEILPVNLRGIAAGADQAVRLIRSAPEGAAVPAVTPPPSTLDTPSTAATDAPKANLIAPAAPVKLNWQPEGVVTKAGSPVVITLQVTEAVDLFSAPVKVKYDPKSLKLSAATAGAFLSTDGQRVNFAYQDSPAAGEVSVVLNRLPGVPGLTGAGALLSLTFQTLAPGVTSVAISESSLKNSKLQSVPAQTPGVAIEIR